MRFNTLLKNIELIHSAFFKNTVSTINTYLTLRNWFIGLYIVEFEQKGTERADYGSKLLTTISKNINIKGLSETNLKLCRQFYKVYPQIYRALPNNLINVLPKVIGQLPTDILQSTENKELKISQCAPDQSKKTDKNYLYQLIKKTSFTHFVELIAVKANKNPAPVEFATAGMDDNLFIRKYLLHLPDKKKLESFLKNELKEYNQKGV